MSSTTTVANGVTFRNRFQRFEETALNELDSSTIMQSNGHFFFFAQSSTNQVTFSRLMAVISAPELIASKRCCAVPVATTTFKCSKCDHLLGSVGHTERTTRNGPTINTLLMMEAFSMSLMAVSVMTVFPSPRSRKRPHRCLDVTKSMALVWKGWRSFLFIWKSIYSFY